LKTISQLTFIGKPKTDRKGFGLIVHFVTQLF